MKHKYLVVGGMVTSQRDKQLHYVSATQLVRLYGVDPRECVLTDGDNEYRATQGMRDFSLIVLRPRGDGDYQLPRIAVGPNYGPD